MRTLSAGLPLTRSCPWMVANSGPDEQPARAAREANRARLSSRRMDRLQGTKKAPVGSERIPRDHLGAVAGGQRREGLRRDAVTEEADGAVAEQEVGTAGVVAAPGVEAFVLGVDVGAGGAAGLEGADGG